MSFKKAGNENDNDNKRVKIKHRFEINNIKNIQNFILKKERKFKFKIIFLQLKKC